jgi:sensor histidine kinase regulating citrate/malate metabolism
MGTTATPNGDASRQHVNSFMVPFVLIAVIMLTSQVIGLIMTMNTSLTQIHNQTLELEALNSESVLRQPLLDNRLDKLQQEADRAKAKGPDVSYIIVEGADGRVLASTDEHLRNLVLADPGFDASVLKVTENTIMQGPRGQESIGLIRKDGAVIGIIRIGVSTTQLMEAIHQTMFSTIFGGIGTLLIGALIYRMFVERILSSILK